VVATLLEVVQSVGLAGRPCLDIDITCFMEVEKERRDRLGWSGEALGMGPWLWRILGAKAFKDALNLFGVTST
jgi:hypothetical protein